MGPVCPCLLGSVRQLVSLARLGSIGLLLCANALWTTNLWAQESKPSEYEVKAAFLFNFARFVEWPEGTSLEDLRICIVGADPFGTAFETVLGQSTGRQPVQVEHLTAGDLPAGDCHILFVSGSESRQLANILRRGGQKPVLTVSDIDGFAQAGGMVGFIIRNNKIRFQINTAAAARADLRLSAKLLRLAEIVDDGGDH